MKKIKLLLFLWFVSTGLFAQSVTVTGNVTDTDGEPLIGATVIEKGTTNGTITDIDGNFKLGLSDLNATLLCRYIGYSDEEIVLNGQNSVQITLSVSNEQLEEVIIVGYGQQKKASTVASISQAKGEDLLKTGSVNTVTEAIQGLMPGVTSISGGTGKPGAEGGEIIIRGKASWHKNGNDPLVLVDGVERNMNDVDPNEIESVSVLKDASATAVYGVKGGNGVILITTKRGNEYKTQIGFTANFGFKQPTASPEYANYVTSMKMWNEALANDQMWDQLIPEYYIESWENAFAEGNYGPYNDYYPQVNWYNELVKKVGYQQQYNLNMRGGTKFMKYFVSLGYLNDGDVYNSVPQEHYDPTFGYKRYNWRTNLDLNLSKTTLLSINLAGKLGYRNQTGYRIDGGGEDGFGQEQFFNTIYRAPQNTQPIKWSDGEWAVNALGSQGQSNPYMDFMTGGQRIYKYYQGFTDIKLKQDLDFITKGLNLKGSFSFTADSKYQSFIRNANGSTYTDNEIAFSREFDYRQPNPDGTLNLITESRWPDADYQVNPVTANYDQNTGYFKRLYYELAMNYGRTFGNHEVTGLALFSRRERKNKVYQVQQRQEDWVGRVTYNYKMRYLAEINGSYNGSEAFAPGLRFGVFYSGSIGWRISEEPFVKEAIGSWLDNLKIRYSYGTVGVDQGERFLYLQSYNAITRGGAANRATLGLGDTQSNIIRNFYTEGDAANDLATWETSVKQNLGVEFGLFSKLNGSLDLYDEKRENILMDVWIPLWYLPPGKSATGNIGETKNHGIELELRWSNKIGSEFRYWAKGNMSLNEGRIVYRNDGVNIEDHLKQAGKPIGWTSTYISNGYYSSIDDIYNYATATSAGEQSKLVPGDMMYADYNADGVIDQLDKVVTKDVKYPLNTYSFSIGADYKGFSFNMLLYGVSNLSKEVPNMILYDNLDGDAGTYLAGPNVEARWTPENPGVAEKPALHTGTNRDYSTKLSTYSYRDASYWRLKNVEVSYSFNEQKLKKYRLGKLQFYVSGNNLLTFTDLDKRLDPEADKLGVFPLVKRYNLGVRASF